MKPKSPPTALEWVRRVNRAWLVKGHLNDHAEAWLKHLEALGDGRLQTSCEAARSMCAVRGPLTDPKPWFYAGLFSLATTDEGRKFLSGHRITKASVPSMENEEDVHLWIDRVGPETQALISRLRAALHDLVRPPSAS